MEIGPVEGALIQLASHLEALRLRWALIGGLAVSALAEPRKLIRNVWDCPRPC